jgi:diguanylate cyclase (GGDEF)-like protein
MGLHVMRRRRSDHSPALHAYTAATILAGIAAFAWAALSFPIDPAISLTASGGSEGILLGLVFWIAIGLLGGTRIQRLRGHGVLTFHMPFIIAAMALGGPTAGALVAMISTIERRELREVVWYGTLANHAALTVSAVAGSVAMLVTRDLLGATIASDAQATTLVALVAGSFVLAIVSTAIVAGTVILRDKLTIREALRVYDSSYRITAANEVVLGWILYLTYLSVGWWAALVCAMLVLAIWQGHDAREAARHDPLTDLLTRPGFDLRIEAAREAARRRGERSALLAIDLDGFKAINDEHGHAAGDEVIREIGARLRAAIRLTDAAARRGGDEFSVLLTDIPNVAAARATTMRIYKSIRAPIRLDDRTVHVGASIGLYIVEPDERIPSTPRLHDLTDRLMYEAKKDGGGILISPLRAG